MDTAFVLIHSPLVGPLTWGPVAERLTAAGAATAVPSLLGVTDTAPPFWPSIVRRVADAAAHLPAGSPLVLVAHSNAGYFVPVIADAVRPRVAGCVFVDAALPARSGPTRVVAPGLLDRLLPRVVDGRLPRWTAWWDEAEAAVLFPDPETQRAVMAEQPQVPLTYYEQRVPVPAGWDTAPCGYLQFTPHYGTAAQDARERGWDVEQVPGEHLHQLVDPATVTAHILALATRRRSET